MKLRALSLVVGLVACSSSESSGGGAPVISQVAVSNSAPKGADGKYELGLQITASDDGKIVSARVDIPSDEPASFVGTEVPVNEQKLDAKVITFRIEGAAGPGTGDANLVLTDDSGNVAKKKIVITMTN